MQPPDSKSRATPQPPMHVLVPVDAAETPTEAAIAGLYLASASGALVTLLYVHERDATVAPSTQLDALSNLQSVLMAPAEASEFAPAYPDPRRAESQRALGLLWRRLQSICPDGVQLRAAWRQGDPLAETAGFIDEAGVDVVVVLAPSFCKSRAMRRLARALPHRCSCQLQTVFPPRASHPRAAATGGAWLRRLVAACRRLWSPAVAPPSAPPAPAPTRR